MDTWERKAIDALMEHKATDDDIGCIEAMLEAAIRACMLTIEQGLPHLDEKQLRDCIEVFMEAARAIKMAGLRKEQTGVYGLNGPERTAIYDAHELVGQMRKPGIILRRTWMQALRQAANPHREPIRVKEAA